MFLTPCFGDVFIFLICRDILRTSRGKYSFVWNCRFWSYCRMKRVCYALYIVNTLMVTRCFSSNQISEVMASFLCLLYCWQFSYFHRKWTGSWQLVYTMVPSLFTELSSCILAIIIDVLGQFSGVLQFLINYNARCDVLWISTSDNITCNSVYI